MCNSTPTQPKAAILKKCRSVLAFLSTCLFFFWSSNNFAQSIDAAKYSSFSVNANVVHSTLNTSELALTYLVPKDSIVLISSSVITPITYMPDLPAYILTEDGRIFESSIAINENNFSELAANSALLNDISSLVRNENIGVAASRLQSYSADTNVSLYSADFNNDGFSDLVWRNGSDIKIISNRNNSLSLYADLQISNNATITSIADVTGDGVTDIVLRTGNREYTYRNLGAGQFSYSSTDASLNTSLVGTTAGNFRVNEQGAATYSVPLYTPTGPGGVSPQLSLNYNSQAGSGIAGQGWSLGGLSGITRCRKTESQDGTSEALSYNSNDRLCLDGQRLILTSGNYGASGSKYRAEIDNGTEVSVVGNISTSAGYLVVTRKDGSRSEYGNSSQSELLVGNVPYNWLLSKFSDSAGNAITFTYINGGNGQRIQTISYGSSRVEFGYEARPDVSSGYLNATLNKLTQRLSSIRVKEASKILRSYHLRYKDIVDDIANSRNPTTANRSYLEALYECDADSKCLSPTRFEWQVTANSHIDNGRDFSEVLKDQRDRVAIWKPIDANGDGLQDIVWIVGDYDNDGHVHTNQIYVIYAKSQGQGFAKPTNIFEKDLPKSDNEKPMPIEVIDFNGDGKQDLAVWDYTSWKVLLSRPTSNGWALSSQKNAIDTGIEVKDAVFADINSDGMVDILYSDKSSLKVRKLQKGSSSNLASADRFYRFSAVESYSLTGFNNSSYPDHHDIESIAIASSVPPADIDGDGLVDFALNLTVSHRLDNYPKLNTRQFVKLIQNSNKLSVIDLGIVNKNSSYFSITPVDINNDGYTDWAYSATSGDYKRWSYSLNNADGSLKKTYVSKGFLATIHKNYKPQFADWNRDGYLDLYWHDDANKAIKVRTWNPTNDQYSSALTIRKTAGSVDTSYILTDINGDSSLDLLVADGENLDGYYGTANNDSNGILRITNGLGSATDIQYKRLADTGNHYKPLLERVGGNASSFYTALNSDWNVDLKSNFDSYGVSPQYISKTSPVLELAAPIQVVTRVSGDAPTASNARAKSHISYSYSEAKIQASGRGLLGFRTVSSTDEQSGIVTTTRYRQDFPFIGRPLITTVKKGSTTLKESFNQDRFYKASVGNDGTSYYQLWTANSFEKTFDLTGRFTSAQKVTTAQPDSWGNLTSINTFNYTAANFSNALTSTLVTNAYGSDEDDKRYGRLSNTRVEHGRQGTGSIVKTSSFTYYSGGAANNLLKTETVNASGAGTQAVTTTYTYDSYGNKISAISNTAGMANRKTNWTYASGRYLTSTTNSLNHVAERITERNAFGLPTLVEGLNGFWTRFEYDSLGRQTYQEDATGAWTKTLYSKQGLISWAKYRVATSQSGGGQTTEYYDQLGRVIQTSTTGFDGRAIHQKTQYDKSGRVYRQSIPYRDGEALAWTTNGYDALGRLTSQQVDGIGTSTIAYQGLKTVYTNPKGQVKSEIHDASGQLSQVIDHSQNKIRYFYTATDQLRQTQVISHEGATINTYLEYDGLGRKIKMRDPDKGTWFYTYNGFGELNEQYKVTHQVQYGSNLATLKSTPARYQRTVMTYDTLGRMVTRKDYLQNNVLEGNTTWTYDTATNGIGKLAREVGGGLTRNYYYGAYGSGSRTDTVEVFDAQGDLDTTFSTVFDSIGRVARQFDGLDLLSGTINQYNGNGYLQKVQDSRSKATLYTVAAQNSRGQVTESYLQDGTLQKYNYETVTGRLKAITASSQATTTNDLLNLSYQWDTVGNLTTRSDHLKQQHQSFCYDNLNRLIKTHQNTTGNCSLTSAQQDVQYDGFGNITAKAGVGTYKYSTNLNVRPHAVSNAGGTTYTYDNNGNLIIDSSGRKITYSSFDKPIQITKGNIKIQFFYGPDRQRWKRVDTNTTSGKVTTTLYLGGVEKVVESNQTRYKRTLPGNALWIYNGSFQLQEKRTLLKDHLGSVVGDYLVGSSQPERYAFDPWGARINAANLTDLVDGSQLTPFLNLFSRPTTRGFTGHEMLDSVGIIHMNGRIYDPRLGRFLQADTIIQFPDYTQGYNRYSYVLNNPLNMTDPSGHILPIVVGAIAAAITTDIVVVAIAVGVASFAQTLAQGGSFGDAFISGISAAALTYMGGSLLPGASTFGDYATAVVSMGTVGGITSTLQGGKFGHGFVSAGIGGLAGGALGGSIGDAVGSELVGNVIGRAIVGGTLTKATGGQFANGARYAAFAAVANWAASRPVRTGGALTNPKVSIETDVKLRDDAINNMNVDETLPEIEARAMSQEPIYMEAIKVVAQASTFTPDYSIDVSGYYRAIARGQARNRAIANYSRGVADLRSWQNFSNTANIAGSAPATLLCAGGIAICYNMAVGGATATLTDLALGNNPSVGSALEGALLGGLTGPVTSRLISASGGSWQATAAWQSNEYFLSSGAGFAIPNP